MDLVRRFFCHLLEMLNFFIGSTFVFDWEKLTVSFGDIFVVRSELANFGLGSKAPKSNDCLGDVIYLKSTNRLSKLHCIGKHGRSRPI